MSKPKRPTLVLGLGNPLMADDGFGLAVLERLRQRWRVPPLVELMDGGTWGMNLLPAIEDAGRLLLIDAINLERPPGAVIRLNREEIPRFLRQKISPHQVDLSEVLAVAELRGTLPHDAVAMGVQPELVELRAGLSPVIAIQVQVVARSVVWQLEQWGHRCRRATPCYA